MTLTDAALDQAIRKELMKRRGEAARKSLAAYCNLIEIPGAPVEDQDDTDVVVDAASRPLAKHHQLLIDRLEKIESGEITRLMVFMPPGSAKSSYASVVFPTWFMGRKKRRNVIVATHASDLARKIGRRARAILRQPIYEQTFGTRLSADSHAADEWALTNENEFMGGGILSGITGNRADLIIIDDPIKGRQDADSETVRARTKAEYQDSITTRGKPGYRTVIIQTRWHTADLAGSILPEDYDGASGPVACRDGQVWEVINLPAEAYREDDPIGRKPGEMLWPEWFTEAHWAPYRANVRTWNALYQQRPIPREGGLFKRPWFDGKFLDTIPGCVSWVRAWDIAGTKKRADNDPDRTAGCLMGRTSDDRFIIAHMTAVQFSPAETEKMIRSVAEGDGWHVPIDVPDDPGAGGKFMVRSLVTALAGFSVSATPPRGSKEARATPLATQAENGNVYIVRGDWNVPFLDELCTFPAARYDDQVDAAASAFNRLAPVVQDMRHGSAGPRVGEKGLEHAREAELIRREQTAHVASAPGAGPRRGVGGLPF